MIVGGKLGYWILRTCWPGGDSGDTEVPAELDKKLKLYFGDDFFDRIRGKTVIDFGCGPGHEAVEMARQGAARVIGIDIQQRMLDAAGTHAREQGVADRCSFVTGTDEKADFVISKDAFEHFDDPEAILRIMAGLLKPGGEVLAAFGPTWFHPYGGHLFSVFPWSHLLFTEKALIRWRSDFKSDGATRFHEVDGGLNGMTIHRFEREVARGPLQLEELQLRPIRGMGFLRHRWLREFGSSLVVCRMVAR